MPFILRVDIDKPYGHHSLFKKILSKIREDYYFPPIDSLGYLLPTIELLNFCNDANIPAFLYFRNCTVPNMSVKELIQKGNYIIGFHAENTLSIDSFKSELNLFELKVNTKINTFTKHGSGTLKLGRNHYAPYEPQKYKDWGAILGLDFSFGNGIAKSLKDLEGENNFYENMFWMEKSYRDSGFDKIESLIEYAKRNIVVLVIHPANFYTHIQVKSDLEKLLYLSRVNAIDWLSSLK